MPFPREELLQHIWQHRLLNSQELKTTDGLPLEILKSGELNTNAGPDFLNSRIRINGTEWAGNVEIHIRASDWLRHSHQLDPAFENIILHAVFENDLKDSAGNFPTIELKHAISDQVIHRYEKLAGQSVGIPCGNQFVEVPKLILNNWIDSLIIARLQRKSEWINELFDKVHGDLEQAFQIVLFRAFGMKVNALPFELMGSITPWKTLGKYKDNLFQLEAILFGYAGFLKFPEEHYQKKLSKEFDFIENKHGASGLDLGLWKFSKMHPKNFPTIRISQLAALYHQTGQFFSWFRDKEVSVLLDALRVEPSEYWQTHYRFGKKFSTKGNRLGAGMAQHLLINVLVPFLFVLAERESKNQLREQAVSILEQLKPEKNSKTRLFESVGFKSRNAMESQALIELKTNYCDRKKCLFCNVGANILRREI
jgi:hypothetical protein